MVVGGRDDEYNYYSNAQLSSTTRSCSFLQNYTTAISGATGAIVFGQPMICGGYYYRSECYHHSKASNSWKFLTNMTTKRAYSASVPVNGMLLVMGGHDGDNRLATTEYVSLDSNPSQPGPDLPTSQSQHCAVKLSNEQVMLLGGYPDKKSVIIFEPNTKRFDQSLPSMTHSRQNAGCAVFNSPLHGNRQVVLAVGGYKQATAEILDYTQDNPTWTESMYRFWQILHWFLKAH